MNKELGVKVPATTANIGSGFDTLGIALSLYNEVYFEPDKSLLLAQSEFYVEGEGKAEIFPGKSNMILQAMEAVSKKIGKEIPGGNFRLVNRIPLARGLGSSSSALVAGAFLANQYLGDILSKNEILNITAGIEGHPDNVAPAVWGGFCISSQKDDTVILNKVKIDSSWKSVVVIPDFELLTEKARSVLPVAYSRQAVVNNIRSLSFLLSAFFFQKPEFLKLGLEDFVHVPYRLSLIPGGAEAIQNAYEAGAYGATISGSGPTMIAFTDEKSATSVAENISSAFLKQNITARYMILEFDQNGVSPIIY